MTIATICTPLHDLSTPDQGPVPFPAGVARAFVLLLDAGLTSETSVEVTGVTDSSNAMGNRIM